MQDALDTLGPVFLPDPVNRQHPLNGGRVAWWLTLPGLDGGGTFYDLMGRSPGTLTNMTSGASGWHGTTRPGGYGQVTTDGINDFVSVADTPALRLSVMSLSCWLSVNTSLSGCVLCKGSGVPSRNYSIVDNGAGTIYYQHTTANAFTGFVVLAAVSLGTWYRMTVTYDGTTVSAYVNGVLAGTTTSAAPDITTDILAFGRTGSYTNTSGNYTNTNLDDVSLWNRALSASDVMGDYELSRRGYPGVLNRLNIRRFYQSLSGTAWSKTLLETLSLADTRASFVVKAMAESLTLSDARTAGLTKKAVESLLLTDTRTAGFSKTLADTLPLTDTRSLAVLKVIAQALAFADTVSESLNGGGQALSKLLTETLALSDTRSSGLVKALGDALGLSDTRTLALAKKLGEALGFSDALVATGSGVAVLLTLVTGGGFGDTTGRAGFGDTTGRNGGKA